MCPLDRRLAYGLRFQSEFALPELPLDPLAEGEADVLVEVGTPISTEEVARLCAPEAPVEDMMRFEEGECQLLFSEVARYTLRAGKHVLVEPREGTSESSWRLPLLGSVMALLLEQRGLLALHGGAARFFDGEQDVAAGFLGDKGQGKSTLNAALSQAGFALLCDDVLAVSGLEAQVQQPPVSQAQLTAIPGFAWLKLLPDAVRGVWNAEPDEFDLVAPEVAEVEKRSIPARLAPEPLPLHHLFILSSLPDEASQPLVLRRLGAQEALLNLIPHTFAARFGALYLKGERRTAHFQACARLASECQIWELARKRDLKLLPQTIQAIENAVRENAVRENASDSGSSLNATTPSPARLGATESGSFPSSATAPTSSGATNTNPAHRGATAPDSSSSGATAPGSSLAAMGAGSVGFDRAQEVRKSS